MSNYTNYSNNYVLKFVPPPENLPWYEQDFMYHLDRSKCEDFFKNTNKHFKETKIVNFDIIYRQARGEPSPSKEKLQEYQTVHEKEVCKYSRQDKNKLFLVLLRQIEKIYTLKCLLF